MIEAKKINFMYWNDVWRFRELLYFLAWRDILVRYKQTIIGILWSVLRPLLTLVVFTLIFGKFAKLPSTGVPYPLLVFAGMLPWYFFATTLSECSESLIGNANLVSKVYFPRIILPVAAMMVGLIDFIISLLLFFILAIGFGLSLTWKILLLPLFLLVSIFVALGFGVWLAAMNVKYRDFRYIIPFLLQLGLYLSPVGFSTSIVPEQFQLLFALNPMVGIIEGYRWMLLDQPLQLSGLGFAFSGLIVLISLGGGIRYFRKVENTFADII